jgi:hypothetical protein
MPEIEINDVASIGAVADVPSYQLPPEAWSILENMRVVDQALESLKGWTEVFEGPIIAPHFALPITTASQTFWLYFSLTGAAVWDGSSHSLITRLSGGYTAGDSKDWNATLLGAVPIINNGVDKPQYWPGAAAGTKLVDLPNWGAATTLGLPATTAAKVIRAFGPYLFALNITDSGGQKPHTLHWAHPAEPGGIPISWDYTDVNRSSRRFDLQDVDSGILLDALRLQGSMYIYKESAVHRATFVGGTLIFDIRPFLENIGLLAARCVATVQAIDGPRHVFASQDDILWHNGNTFRSVLTQRARRKIFANIDSQNAAQCFMFYNPTYQEAWFCYPEQGSVYPTKAVIMNTASDPWRVTYADDIDFRNVAIGVVEGTTDEIWDEGDDTWDDDTGPWSQISRRKVVVCNPTKGKFFQLDTGDLRDGVPFASRAQRTGLAILGQKRTGEWITDFKRYKMLKRFWIKSRGGPVLVRAGVQDLVDGEVTYRPAALHDPRNGVFADVDQPISGRAIAVDFFSEGGEGWTLDGYTVDIEPLGNF